MLYLIMAVAVIAAFLIGRSASKNKLTPYQKGYNWANEALKNAKTKADFDDIEDKAANCIDHTDFDNGARDALHDWYQVQTIRENRK